MEAENHGHHELATTIRRLVEEKRAKRSAAKARIAEKNKLVKDEQLLTSK
jgi:hypothetical protein